MSPLTLHHGDCLAVLPTVAENSLDACVTDPPYGLEFMGKDWDHGVPGVPFWREIIRVLKPGAHLVAFGGSRTYHRMAVAIEDAGFEIRDSLMWLYGSGFPKSMDVSKAIDKADGAKRERYARPALGGSFSDDGGTTYGTALVNEPITDAAREWEGWGTALKPAHEPITVATKPISIAQHFAILLDYLTDLLEEQTIWSGLNAHVAEQNFSAIRAKLNAVTRPTVLESARMRVLANFDPARFANHSSIFREQGFCVETKTPVDSALSHARQSSSAASYLALTTPHGPADDLSIQLAAMCMSVVTDGISENTVSSWASLSDAILNRANTFTIETASRLTIALRTWNSLTSPNIIDGTGSLFPNVSPIVLARKPLSEGTIAANVLRWGTGALNIDGCRVGTDRAQERQYDREAGSGTTGSDSRAEGYGLKHAPRNDGWLEQGRWPANVVHDGSDEVIGAFPFSKDGVAGKRNAANGDVMKTGLGATDKKWGGFGGSGSAARFFYCAKASKEDRADSKHPTVKPIRLLCWLARMVTPPGGVILDPFAGSGTTAAAAAAERFGALLIEQEAEYAADIRRRIAALTVQPALL